MSNKHYDLGALHKAIAEQSAPLDSWYPDFCGEIDIRINEKGQWFHQGQIIGRASLVRLFARVLCRENGQYYLKTPAEKLAINVDDAPLLITDWYLHPSPELQQQLIVCVDNLGREYIMDKGHPLTVHTDCHQQQVPYLQLPYGVEAKVARSVFYHWVEQLAKPSGSDYVIYSGECVFSLVGSDSDSDSSVAGV